MDLELSPEQKALYNDIRAFVDEVIAPQATYLEQNEVLPKEILNELGKRGYMGVTIPEKYGGLGADNISYEIVCEEVSRGCGSTGITVAAHNTLGIQQIYLMGSEEQKERWIPPLATGKKLGSWGLTEPQAGSDAGGLQTTAVPDGDEWIINGSKIFITSGHEAEIFTIMAMTDKAKRHRGISAFVVERGTPGFRLGAKEDKLGLRATVTSELVFEDCRVPKENMLGERGMGFIGAMNILDSGRIGIGAMALGIAQAAFDAALEYAKTRQAFGRPIGKKQAIAFMLSNMAMEIDAARLLLLKAAWLKDNKKPFTKEAAMGKLFASEVGTKICSKAIQIHGGHGFTTRYPVERFYRDAKITEIYEGTTEVQKMVISGNLLK
ncbi:MAG: acyl-CoA dehydrogenase family protein [Thermoplasmata archaeon]|nr:acyl-CoA dehydrogenase family protein [Thermoplasmata archaeon]